MRLDRKEFLRVATRSAAGLAALAGLRSGTADAGLKAAAADHEL